MQLSRHARVPAIGRRTPVERKPLPATRRADAWWYTATAADGQEEESAAVHARSTEAIARATEFLLVDTQAAP